MAIARLRWRIGAVRARATAVGMPTLASHGPRSTTALPNTRSTPSMPVITTEAGTSAGFRCWPGAAVGRPTYSAASRLRATTMLSASVSVTTEPGGSGIDPRIRSSASRCTDSPSTPTTRSSADVIGYAENDGVPGVARPAQHPADPGLAALGDLAQEARVQLALDRRLRRLRPRQRPPADIGHERVAEQQIAPVDQRQQHVGGRGRIELLHAGVARRRDGHRIGGLEVAIHIHRHRRRHRRRLGGELADEFFVGEARGVKNCGIDDDRQQDRQKHDLPSEWLRQTPGAPGEWYQPAAPIKGSVAPASAKPAARSWQLSQRPHGPPPGRGS